MRDTVLSTGVPWAVALSGLLLLLLARRDGWIEQDHGECTVALRVARGAVEEVWASADGTHRATLQAFGPPFERCTCEALALTALRKLVDNALRCSPRCPA